MKNVYVAMKPTPEMSGEDPALFRSKFETNLRPQRIAVIEDEL